MAFDFLLFPTEAERVGSLVLDHRCLSDECTADLDDALALVADFNDAVALVRKENNAFYKNTANMDFFTPALWNTRYAIPHGKPLWNTCYAVPLGKPERLSNFDLWLSPFPHRSGTGRFVGFGPPLSFR